MKILHTNDMHGTLSAEKFEKLVELREGCDLYFDSGDAIKTGNLGFAIRPEPVWPLLQNLNCTASVLGNRETHLVPSAFEAKLAGATHPILCANLHRRDGSHPLLDQIILQVNGLRIGVIGVMVPMVTSRMKTQLASAYLWDPPIKTALDLADVLRTKVDVLFCLSHIGYRQDLQLAETGAFDVIFGGHSHTILQSPEQIGKTYLVQGGSHNRFAGRYVWDGALQGSLIPLGG